MADDIQDTLQARLTDVLSDSYEIEGEIGRGGMGIVFSARDIRLRRRVAIKVLPPELAFRGEIRKRFTREAQTAARLSHPHIVPIHTVGEEGGLVYFVMGYVDGESLAARLRRRERLPIEETRRIMKETADALGLAHAMGIVHRDIKPDNILLEGTRRRVMVTDFGIAKALTDASGGTLTGTGVAIGTPAYMSPEQAAGDSEIDARSDIYSLGVVAYEMLTGEVPFKAPTVAGILLKQVTQPVPNIQELRRDCPDDLVAAVARCLDKEPENRWPTADTLRRALESRSSGPYRPRSALSRHPGPARRPRPSPAAKQDTDWWRWFEEGRASSGRPREARARDRAVKRRDTEESPVGPVGEPTVVRKFRGNFASYVSVNGGLLLLNVVTGLATPWFLFPAIGWGIGLASQYGKLWSAGYSMRDVLNRPPADDALPSPNDSHPSERRRLPAPTTGDFGLLAGQIEQMRKDHSAIIKLIDRLPESERVMLPDVVPTVESLFQRATDLARTLQQMEGQVDQNAVNQLEERIAELEGEETSSEKDRRLDLLKRQRATLAELTTRRGKIEGQFESCVLAIQNVRFDLLRLRSAGVAEVLSDLTSATQAARALKIDVEAAIDAAGEIKEALGGYRTR
ncbi:MAG: protein kinase [Gemmatimonadota bacterium]|nr:protein kinase [Gemmatimonadota bacterium]MDH3367205.1 protein kinase [Gemmatimonadota bacterium]MDH3476907.1 protein kinase [Gemmatimonadota bacterium]MDH3568590.1 protein kinase [Gemmatimonadota bacterium]MDH5548289.1 protein kinase [Gemmatimonadota bacterium]